MPIKLLFPRPPVSGEAPDTVSLAMLGLGDIIIPGMMVGLALRFDLYLYCFLTLQRLSFLPTCKAVEASSTRTVYPPR